VALGPVALSQVTYDKQLLVQPIQVCTTGGDCGNPGRQLRPEMTQVIMDQANMQIIWLPWNTFTDDMFINVGKPPYDVTFDFLVSFPQFRNGSANPQVVNIWFVKDLRRDGTGENLAGLTRGRGIVIDDEGIVFKDIVAHELGHSLISSAHSASPADNLMLASPLHPSTVQDVMDGTHSQLTANQIDIARNSTLVAANDEAPPVVAMQRDGAEFTLSWAPINGYSVQSRSLLDPLDSWMDETNAIDFVGSSLVTTAHVSGVLGPMFRLRN
jgi:hypothetical protein